MSDLNANQNDGTSKEQTGADQQADRQHEDVDAEPNSTSDMLGDTQGQDPRLTDRKADGADPEDWEQKQHQAKQADEPDDHSL